ncbi:MAG: hypothetical protein AB8C46_25455 [Burkholderiaceae bacterium]
MSKQPDRPPTFDAQFVLTKGGRFERLRRDVRVLKFLGMTFLLWATKGRRVRRAYQQAKASGQPFVLERDVLPILQGKRR